MPSHTMVYALGKWTPSLWNTCVRLSATQKNGRTVAEYRKYACTQLEEYKSPPEMARFWARTAKEYLDVNDLSEAKACLAKVVVDDSDQELLVSFWLWCCELRFKQGAQINEEAQKLVHLLK